MGGIPSMNSSTGHGLVIYFALGIGVFIIGFSPIFIRLADAPGIVTGFYRMGIAAVIITIPFIISLYKRNQNLSKRELLTAILGGSFFGLDIAFWATGITLSGATNPTLLANTAPLWVGLGSWLLFGEKQSKFFWIGLFLAIFGATLVLGQDMARAAAVGLGTFMGLLAAVFYGAYYLTTQRGRATLDTLSYFWIICLSSAAFLLVLNLTFGNPLTGYNIETWIYFILVGIIVQVLGWFLITFVQGYLPASIVAPTLLGQPVVTGLVAVPLLGETFTEIQILGGFAVMVGILVIHRSRINS